MWEMCRVGTGLSKFVRYWSWRDGWGELPIRDYLAQFYPEWFEKNPKRDHFQDLILVLLGHGWEPYAYDNLDYFFRRHIISNVSP